MASPAAPSGSKELSQQQAFRQTWSPSSTTILAATSLPLIRAPRAWDRRPQDPCNNDARYSKVWKRYGLRSGSTSHPTTSEAAKPNTDTCIEDLSKASDSRVRATKRLRLKRDSVAQDEQGDNQELRVQYIGTRYSRRLSGSTRKGRSRSRQANGLASTDALNGPFRGNEQKSTSSALSPKSTAARELPVRRSSKKRSYGRYSLGSSLRSGQKPDRGDVEKENSGAPELAAMNLSPRKFIRAKRRTKSPYKAAEPSQLNTSPDEDLKSNDATALEENAELISAADPAPEKDTSSPEPSPVEEGGNADYERPIPAPELGNIVADFEDDSEDDETASESDIALQEAYEPTTNLQFSPEAAVAFDSTIVHKGNTDDPILRTDSTSQLHTPVTDELRTAQLPKSSTPPTNASGSPSPAERIDDDITVQALDDATLHLELDTALLKAFLSRSEAAKASKKIDDDTGLSTLRRSSLQNRRDSDAVRLALASPRRPLDPKDVNSPLGKASVRNPDGLESKAELKKLSSSLLAAVDSVDLDLPQPGVDQSVGSRRSSRARSRALQEAEPDKVNKTIQVKLTADGINPASVILKKTEAQELSLLTRTNTRRNKGKSVIRREKLKELLKDGLAPAWEEGKIKALAAINRSQDNEADMLVWKVPQDGEKGVRWQPKAELVTYWRYNDTDAARPDVPNVKDDVPRIPAASAQTSLSASVLQAETWVDSPRKASRPDGRVRRRQAPEAEGDTPAKKGLLSFALPSADASAAVESPQKAPERLPQVLQEEPKSRLPMALKKSKLVSPRKIRLPPSDTANASASVSGKESTQEAREKEQRRLASPRKMSQLLIGNTSVPAPSERLVPPERVTRRSMLR